MIANNWYMYIVIAEHFLRNNSMINSVRDKMVPKKSEGRNSFTDEDIYFLALAVK